jgi:GNAT superfamily N-acetyltransferase
MGTVTPPRPLAAVDDRNAFDCGREALNEWFLRHAWRNQESGASRTSVIADVTSGAIAGFVSLSMSQIERGWLAKADRRNQPDPIPALLVGQLAVHVDYQRRGHAASLMSFALTTTVRIAEQVGCFAAITQPLDDDLRAFYGQFGFVDLTHDPKRCMAVKISSLRLSGFAI